MAGILIEWRIEELLLGSMVEAEKEAGVNTGTSLAFTTPISSSAQKPESAGQGGSGHHTQKGPWHQEENLDPGSSPGLQSCPRNGTWLRESLKIGN